jgi:hypothetical protein
MRKIRSVSLKYVTMKGGGGRVKSVKMNGIWISNNNFSMGMGSVTLWSVNNNNNPWRYSSDEPWAGWAAAAGSLFRLHQMVLGWHVVSTSNPTATFSAFQTGPLLLYSSNYSVYPIMRLSGPRSRPNSLRKILECPGIEPGTSVVVVFNANH